MNAPYTTYKETIEGHEVVLCCLTMRGGYRSWWAELDGKRLCDGACSRKGIRQDAASTLRRMAQVTK